jgi:hypothetical protein
MKLIVNLRRIAPGRAQPTAQVSPSPVSVPGSTTTPRAITAETPTSQCRFRSSDHTVGFAPVGGHAKCNSGCRQFPRYQVSRRCVELSLWVHRILQKRTPDESSASPESDERNRVSIRPLKRTYVKVTVDDENQNPAFERWISPGLTAQSNFEVNMSRFVFSILMPLRSEKTARQ